MSKKYDFAGLRKMEGFSIGYIEGWLNLSKNNITLEEKTVKGEKVKVAKCQLVTSMHPSKTKYHFGEEVVNDKELVYIQVSLWKTTGENFAKILQDVKKNIRVGMFGAIKVTTNTKDGKTYHNVNMSCDEFKIISSLKDAKDSTGEPQADTQNDANDTPELPF